MVNKLIFDFDFGQTDRGMDICDSRVAFVNENTKVPTLMVLIVR